VVGCVGCVCVEWVATGRLRSRGAAFPRRCSVNPLLAAEWEGAGGAEGPKAPWRSKCVQKGLDEWLVRD